MQTMATQVGGFQAIFERKGVELGHPLRNRTTSSSRGTRTKWTKFSTRPNEILPLLNVDRDSALLREVQAALLRAQDGTFGTCIDCESPISPKRLAAVPWASRCIRCQESADRHRHESAV
jgi:DnaK suppressor protein